MSKNCKDILIVEDQLFFQDVLEIALRDIVPKEAIIKKSISGNRAIELLKIESDSIGLILLDMKMEDGDGITVLNYLEQNALSDIPVYIVSSLDSEFISFVMQSISEIDIRLVGFIPKDTPDFIIDRISDIEKDILTFLLNDKTKIQHNPIKYDPKDQGSDIITKLESDLILYVQPKINIQEGGYISGYEVLSRLYDEQFGIIEPNNFLHYIDTLDKKLAFNWLVLEKTFKSLESSIQVGAYYNLSVNVDPDVLGHKGFVNKFDRLAKKHNVDVGLVTIELTEDSQIESSKLYFNIAQLKLLGVKFSLDDFGKGYSNLDRVDRIPFDEVKIDLNLIAKVRNSEKEKELVVSILHYIKDKGCNVVAEGVEDKDTNDFLKFIGFHEAQGYYYSMPKPMSEIDTIFIEFFKSRVSLLMGDMSSESFLDIYNYFHINAVEVLDKYLAREVEIEQNEFVHQVKGILKTAGLNEGLKFIELYSNTEDELHIIRLKNYLNYFNKSLLKDII
ncbi:EAL domain-containing protein [Vibrio sp. F74]|uniref:EAL domain-containing protein n=1 Tax=Vibrio sp. F74 TaxID=700020 RepID=UPI0035F5E8F8